MKLAFIVNKLNIGGPQKVIAFLANNLTSDGHNVSIISYSDKKSNIRIDQRVNIIYLGYEAEYYNRLGYIKKRLMQVPLVLSIRNRIVEIDPDIVCAFTISILRMTQIAIKGLRYPIVSSERGNPFQYSRNFLYTARKAYSRCNLVVFQTEKSQSLLNIDNSTVIPNPAIPRNMNANRVKTNKKNLILAAGRLEKEKGFDLLISCIPEVLKHIDCYLKIYGSGSMRDKLNEIIKENNLNQYVELSGEDNSLFENNSDAALFVLSSYTEGMPNVLIEAMMCGIPCIATDCTSGGPHFLLGDGRAGYLIDVGNKEQMTEMILYVLTHRDEAVRKVEEATIILNSIAPGHVYQMWLDSFQNIIRKC